MADHGARFAINPPFAALPTCTAVLNGKPRDYRVESYETTLSLKSVVAGEALYRAGRGRFRIEPGSLLLLNHGQRYALDVEAASRTETLCVFFQPGFVEGVACELERSIDGALDELDVTNPATPAERGFCERLHAKSGAVADVLRRLHAGLRGSAADGGWLEARMYELAAALVEQEAGVRREVDAFPGARPATRAELYRRLHLARDFIESAFEEPLPLARLARVACLSPYHFHRTFRAAFGRAPGEYVQARRLAAACALLTRTERDVTSIALDVGFESLGSFSWLFRRRFGLSPRAYRARARSNSARSEKPDEAPEA